MYLQISSRSAFAFRVSRKTLMRPCVFQTTRASFSPCRGALHPHRATLRVQSRPNLLQSLPRSLRDSPQTTLLPREACGLPLLRTVARIRTVPARHPDRSSPESQGSLQSPCFYPPPTNQTISTAAPSPICADSHSGF